jgi:hypothetical protein
MGTIGLVSDCGVARAPDRGGAEEDASANAAAESGSGDTMPGPGTDAAGDADADAGTSADVLAEFRETNNSRCPFCPPSPPEAGTPCPIGRTSLGTFPACEYGDDPRLVNLVALCNDGAWDYGRPVVPLVDSGLPLGTAGCPATYPAALVAPSCDIPWCLYPEGTCTCQVFPGANATDLADAATAFSCLEPALPSGCPSSIDAARSSTTCPSNELFCYYPGGTCVCEVSDAGSSWSCTVPASGCPSTRPRLGSPCDPAFAGECDYLPIACSSLTGRLQCIRPGLSAPCGGIWVSVPGALCQ